MNKKTVKRSKIRGAPCAVAWMVLGAVLMGLHTQAVLNASQANLISGIVFSAAADEIKTADPKKTPDKPALPDWVEHGSFVDEQGVFYLVVGSDPLTDPRHAEKDLQQKMTEAIKDKLDELIAPGAGQAIEIDAQMLKHKLIVPERTHLVAEENDEYLVRFGERFRTVYSTYGQVKLDHEFLNWAGNEWEEQLVQSRLMQTSLIGISIIGFLGVGFFYFQMDRATRGLYTRRLQTVALLVVVILVIVGLAVFGSLDWL